MLTHPASELPAGCREPKPGRGSVQTRERSGVSAGSTLRQAWNKWWDREVRRRLVRAHRLCTQESLVRIGARLGSNADASEQRYAGGLSGTDTWQG